MTTSVDQRFCCHCEEVIHPYATCCPYCGREQEAEEAPPPPPPSAPLAEAIAQEKPASNLLAEGDWQSSLLPIFLLLPGVVFFLFGLALMLYSHEGVLTLRWDEDLWPFFLFSSFALMFFGWRALSKVPDESDDHTTH